MSSLNKAREDIALKLARLDGRIGAFQEALTGAPIEREMSEAKAVYAGLQDILNLLGTAEETAPVVTAPRLNPIVPIVSAFVPTDFSANATASTTPNHLPPYLARKANRIATKGK